MHIYLAHPIDQAIGSAATSPVVQAIAHVMEAARQQGIGIYIPGAAHKLPPPPWQSRDSDVVDRINRHAIWECDGTLAIIVPGVPTLGVPSEIEYSLTLNRPTAIITTERLRSSSVQLANWASRGVQILLCGENGQIFNPNLAHALGSLPDPTRLVGEQEDMGAPSLLVTGEAANARRGQYQGDAGVDLALLDQVHLDPGEYGLFRTGVRAAIPDGWFGLITGRSSTWAKYRCDVRQAVIDSGYRGELMVGVENRGERAVSFMPGTRLGQMVLLPVWDGKIEVVEKLPEAERGEAGYGSSGH